MELRLIPTPRFREAPPQIVVTPEQRERSRRIRQRFEIAMAPPGSIRLTPQQQAAKDLADMVMAKHPTMTTACEVLIRAIERDQHILFETKSPEALVTAEARIELHRQALDFIGAAHMHTAARPATLE